MKNEVIMRTIPMTAFIYAAAHIRRQSTTNAVTLLREHRGSCIGIECEDCPVHSGYKDKYNSYCYANQIMNLVMADHDLLGIDKDPETHAKIIMLLIGQHS